MTRALPRLAALSVSALFLGLVALAVRQSYLPALALKVYLLASAAAVLIYGVDKAAARYGGGRFPQVMLHALSLAGGWPGALVAQSMFRHKSSKRSFMAVFWVTVVMNITALAWVMSAKQAATVSLPDPPWRPPEIPPGMAAPNSSTRVRV